MKPFRKSFFCVLPISHFWVVSSLYFKARLKRSHWYQNPGFLTLTEIILILTRKDSMRSSLDHLCGRNFCGFLIVSSARELLIQILALFLVHRLFLFSWFLIHFLQLRQAKAVLESSDATLFASLTNVNASLAEKVRIDPGYVTHFEYV